MRRLLVVVALTAAGLAATVAAAAPAAAHAKLRTSTPAAGSTLKKAPSQVVLTFSTKVREKSVVVRVDGPGGAVASTGAVQVDGRVVTQPLGAGLANGEYVVRWKATANDGHQLTGTVPFSLAAPAAATPTQTVAENAAPSATAAPQTASAQTSSPAVPTTPTPTAPSDADLAPDVEEDPATWPVVAALVVTAAAVGGFVLLRRRAAAG